MTAKAKRLFFAAALTLTTFAAVEFVARVALSIDPIFDRIVGQDDASMRLRWVRAQRSRGPRFAHPQDRFDSTLGWVSVPNARARHGSVPLSINSKDLRGPREYDYEKPPDTTRIVVIGDSFTFGEGVRDEETYPYLLQSMLPGSEVLNLGVHGYGQDQMLLLPQREGVKYGPDIVLLGFNYEDVSRNGVSFGAFAKPKFAIADGRLVNTRHPLPSPESVLRWEWTRPKIFDL